ncbi:NYN domain-containing protein [Pantoea allii]|uniref:NYN domain-containing protein n=1 Tax=Pantoea allii TaxID=574096 RepID=A0A2V2BCI5_9GAMM|nr:NYN domain-containing protein [Pantoea allii]PWK94324.1 NYN domain-containing protein [Pantoea allii]
MRTAFFIDGYNLFYGLLAGTDYKWLDLPALLTHITKIQNPASETLQINYFTSPVLPSLATLGIQSKEAQDTYIRALKAKGVIVALGKHRLEHGTAPRYIDKHTPASRKDKVDIWDLEEKQTDVSLAIGMYRLLSQQRNLQADERIEQVVLVSADTDMTPALKAIQEDFPEITVGIILPHREGIDRGVPGSLNNYAHWVRKNVKIAELQAHQFPDRVPTKKKPAIKPHYW